MVPIPHKQSSLTGKMKLQVFGSAGVIGNPVGFARSLGLGIKDFFSLPIWSVFQVYCPKVISCVSFRKE